MKKLVFSVFCMAVVLASIASVVGCNLNLNESPIGPTYAPAPTAVTPTPTPVPQVKVTPTANDVSSMAIFLYGYTCPSDVTPPTNNALFKVPLKCSADLTATPKNASGVDAQDHGDKITWAPDETDVARITPHPSNPLFNRVFTPKKVGTFTATATLITPDGRVITATRSIEVTP